VQVGDEQASTPDRLWHVAIEVETGNRTHDLTTDPECTAQRTGANRGFEENAIPSGARSARILAM